MTPQLFEKPPVVVTGCTTRKRVVGIPVSMRSIDGMMSPARLATRWASLVADAPKTTGAGNLYVGRAFFEAKTVARSLSADLYIVSAGLGLVSEADMVPNYDLTVGSSPGSLQTALASTESTAATWWNALTPLFGCAYPLARMVAQAVDRMVLVALPATYLEMVRDDLAQLTAESSSRLRILTSPAGRSAVPGHLGRCVLPYDERLEALGGYNGTRADFPQRALRHFIEVIGGHRCPLHEAHAAVDAAMSVLSRRELPAREKQTDEQIASLLHENWSSHHGSATRLLRYLRDEALVACEQSRFQQICRKVRTDRELQQRRAYAT